jgi:hypothetical protein
MCDNYENWPTREQWIRDTFPSLRNDDYEETSPQTCVYNCIAWAAEDIQKWWWPSPDSFWPLDSIEDETVENFQSAFEITGGYAVCEDGHPEPGFEKIAIFASGQRVTHMARQLQSGVWTSKLGSGWDISHRSLAGVNCGEYGEAVSFMRRPKYEAT